MVPSPSFRSYAIVCEYPANGTLVLAQAKPAKATKATLLFGETVLAWAAGADGMSITLPTSPPLGSSLAWVIRLEGLAS